MCPRRPTPPARPTPPRHPTARAVQAPSRVSRTGRNLPVAIGVGAGLGGLVLLTLLTVKATFLLYVGAAIAVALTELAEAFTEHKIDIPVIPVAAGGAAVLTCMYWLGSQAALAALALTVVAIFAWRLPGGPAGYVRDVTAGVFALIYLPFLAAFVVAMLSPANGPQRVLTFVIVTICSDIGGYFASGGVESRPILGPRMGRECRRVRNLRTGAAREHARFVSHRSGYPTSPAHHRDS